jgi:energy-coupling factor transporter transmembrane protein EcfT
MQRKPLFIFLFALLCLTVAFVFRRTIYQIVILPLAYVWWWLTLYYRLLPQAAIWILLIFIILFTTMRGLLLEIPWGWSRPLKKKKSQGPIESLAVLIQKSSEGNYYKWTIANRLGRAARELLDQREGSQGRKKIMRFSDRNWDAPQEVSAYLEAGLNGTFADYPKRSWSRAPRTPLDVDPQQVIEYLESELENRNGHR